MSYRYDRPVIISIYGDMLIPNQEDDERLHDKQHIGMHKDCDGNINIKKIGTQWVLFCIGCMLRIAPIKEETTTIGELRTFFLQTLEREMTTMEQLGSLRIGPYETLEEMNERFEKTGRAIDKIEQEMLEEKRKSEHGQKTDDGMEARRRTAQRLVNLFKIINTP